MPTDPHSVEGFPNPALSRPGPTARSRDARAGADSRSDTKRAHASDAMVAGRPPTLRARILAELEDLAGELRTMTGRLNEDFVNARVGLRHNTYEHRSRLVRQLKRRLDTMRLTAEAVT